ncbi:MAG: hypothetical protein JRN26_00860 [Nitrososphaerota archaeon]|nr:hypothetical protein [Nitrososphaerota archaeon]MDG6932937.1 hypothetical protein [Nitrososphaerota archaeon]MDG6935430.1 hypothetical protein [Nitrososphaerota archaeon]MDG6944714.1 hypothetical protein [Nitrososphaerota archaeon]
MPEFWKQYASIEAALKLKPDEFIKNTSVRERAITGIKGLAELINKRGEELLKRRGISNELGLPAALSSLRVINGPVADELSELLELESNIERADIALVYSNLVRFMEVFEEVYLAIEESLTENK